MKWAGDAVRTVLPPAGRVGSSNVRCLFPVQTDARQCEHYFFSSPTQSWLKSSRNRGLRLKDYCLGIFPTSSRDTESPVGSVTAGDIRTKYQAENQANMAVKLSQRLSADLIYPLNCFYQKFLLSLKLDWRKKNKQRNRKPEDKTTNKNNFFKAWSRGGVYMFIS